MSEPWQQLAALGDARHRVVMALLDSTLADPKNIRELEIFTAINDINTIVDEVDRTNSAAISKVRDMLDGKLVQLQSEGLSAASLSALA